MPEIKNELTQEQATGLLIGFLMGLLQVTNPEDLRSALKSCMENYDKMIAVAPLAVGAAVDAGLKLAAKNREREKKAATDAPPDDLPKKVN